MDFGFPELTDSFLNGQNIFYSQFNEVEFFVEDTDQENLYYVILKKLFPDIRFEKIFPLNGKTNVTNAAIQQSNDHKKIYIVDLDFDHIIGTKRTDLNNLFYLERYSIENYFVSQTAINELIIEKYPKKKRERIINEFNINDFLTESQRLLDKLFCCFLIIRKYSLGIEYFTIDAPKHFNFSTNPPIHRDPFISNYFNDIENSLKLIDGRYTLRSKLIENMKYFRTTDDLIRHAPGKYILHLLKHRLGKLIETCSSDSFSYKLAKMVDENKLNNLKIEISNYISN